MPSTDSRRGFRSLPGCLRAAARRLRAGWAGRHSDQHVPGPAREVQKFVRNDQGGQNPVHAQPAARGCRTTAPGSQASGDSWPCRGRASGRHGAGGAVDLTLSPVSDPGGSVRYPHHRRNAVFPGDDGAVRVRSAHLHHVHGPVRLFRHLRGQGLPLMAAAASARLPAGAGVLGSRNARAGCSMVVGEAGTGRDEALHDVQLVHAGLGHRRDGLHVGLALLRADAPDLGRAGPRWECWRSRWPAGRRPRPRPRPARAHAA